MSVAEFHRVGCLLYKLSWISPFLESVNEDGDYSLVVFRFGVGTYVSGTFSCDDCFVYIL